MRGGRLDGAGGEVAGHVTGRGVGLVRGLLYAGAQSVMLTLWWINSL